MSLTLYWNLASQPARSVKCLLDLGKLAAKLVSMEIGKDTRSKQFLSLNPLGKIPFLVDGDFKVGESNAILVYLCEKYPSQLGKYYGSTPKQRAKVNQHLNYYQNFFRPALFKIIHLKIYEATMSNKPIYDNQIKAAEKEMFSSIGQFQALLKHSGTKFVAGDSLTIADLQYFFEMTNMIYYEKTFSDYQLTTSWYNRVAEVDEVKAITQEWLKLAPTVIQTLKSVPVKPKL